MTRSPSFWMTALCIWLAGAVSSAAISLVLPHQLASSGPGVSLLLYALAAAFVGAFVLQAVLPRLAGVSISYAWAAIALGFGSLAGNGVVFVVRTFTRSHGPTAAPLLWSNPTFSLAGTAVGFFVSYWLITLAPAQTARGAKTASGAEVARVPADTDAWDDNPSHPPGLGDVLARTQQAVAQACIDISRSPGHEIPGHVVDALTEIATCAHSLQHATTPDPKVRAEVQRLLDGLNRFQTSLGQIADDAAATGSDHLYQRGIVFGSMADVSDGGGLARYELNQADGLAAIRESFDRLRDLGALAERS